MLKIRPRRLGHYCKLAKGRKGHRTLKNVSFNRTDDKREAGGDKISSGGVFFHLVEWLRGEVDVRIRRIRVYGGKHDLALDK